MFLITLVVALLIANIVFVTWKSYNNGYEKEVKVFLFRLTGLTLIALSFYFVSWRV